MKELFDEIFKDLGLVFNRKNRRKLKKIYKVIDKECEELIYNGFDLNDQEIKEAFENEVSEYVRKCFIEGNNEREDISDIVEDGDDSGEAKKTKLVAFRPNKGRQNFAVRQLFCFDTLFGGSMGGGKTFAILLRVLFMLSICARINKERRKHGLIPGGGRYLILRREMGGLKDLRTKSFEVFGILQGIAIYTQDKWTFHVDGSIFTVELGYISDEKSFTKFQGQEYLGVYVDEAGQMKPDEFVNVISVKGRTRNPYGFPSDFMLTANPGGPGHLTLQERYGVPSDGSQDIIVKKTYNGDIISVDHKKYNTEPEEDELVSYRMFIPSTIKDNPYLANTDYIARLRTDGMSEAMIANLIEGKWTIDAHGVFDDVLMKPTNILDVNDVEIPNTWIFFRGYDFGTRDPYAGLVFAKNNGKGNLKIGGKEKITPVGTVIAVNESYGGGKKDPAKPFEGNGLEVYEQTKHILKMEDQVLDRYNIEKIYPGYADGSIYTNGIKPDSVEGSASEELSRSGLHYIAQKRPKGSRIQGIMKIRKMLRASIENSEDIPHLYIVDKCEFLIKEMRAAAYDKDMSGDIKNSADHAIDVLRYNVHTPKTKNKKKVLNNTMPARFG